MLYTPIAFIVVFCNFIDTLYLPDLTCLQDLHAQMQFVRHPWKAMGMLQKLVNLLCNCASKYAELKMTDGAGEGIHEDLEPSFNDTGSQRVHGPPFSRFSEELSDMIISETQMTDPLTWINGVLECDDWLVDID
jgi:hypothetical protein